MDEVIFVELLGRTGDVAHRVPLGSLPATVGRAYDNDVIVDDPFVAPHHLRIERRDDGSLGAVDLGTRNGLHVLPDSGAGDALRLRIGHTLLRVRRRDFPVAAEQSDPVAARWGSVPAAVLLLCAYLALLALHTYAGTVEEFVPARLFIGLPIALVVPAAWAGAWAAIGRLTAGRAMFFAHATLTLIGLVATLVIEPFSNLLAFSLSLPVIVAILPLVLGAIGGTLLFGQLRLVSRQPTALLATAAIVVVALGVSGTYVAGYLEAREDVSRLDAMHILEPPFTRLAPGVSVDAFIEGAQALEKPLAKLRDEP